MADKKLHETDYLLAWLLFAIATMIVGYVVGAIVGAIIGGILGAMGVNLQVIYYAAGAASFLANLPFSYIFFRIMVSQFIVAKVNKLHADDGHADAH